MNWIATPLGFIVFATGVYAQPAFEAASIKPSLPMGQRTERWLGVQGGPGTSDPGRITGRNMSVKNWVEYAYGLAYYQVYGPDWAENERFDIDAKLALNSTKDDLRLMLQKLFQERFDLVVHRETRQLPVYRLVLAKGGSKLQAPAPDNPDAPKNDGGGKLERGKDGYPILTAGTTMAIMPGPDGKPRARAQGHKKGIDAIVGLLAGQMSTPVIDSTGLKAEYDYVLSWIPTPPGVTVTDEASEVGPDLFQAIQQQLGLKLEAGKGPVEVMVIDSARKAPTEN
jgi:uncharacterized protein (TIGR03435 family)